MNELTTIEILIFTGVVEIFLFTAMIIWELFDTWKDTED